VRARRRLRFGLVAAALSLSVAGVIPPATPPQAPQAPQRVDVARQPPRFVRLSDAGPSFLPYDGSPTLGQTGRDWPVSLVFAGNASITRVKSALRAAGLTRLGLTRYLAYRTRDATIRFDGDRGLKSPCDADGTDTHVRLYAPTATDRFLDPHYGSVVLGTTHLDRADGCSVQPTMFGFSEEAERRVAALLARRGWRVQVDRLALGNSEPYRRELVDPAHMWWSDGRATLITVP
jgi:hypothetical protein